MAFRICVVGCGGLSTRAHGPSCRRYARLNNGVVLAACCDLDGAKAETYAQRFGFAQSYTDVHQMLERECPDAVCLMAPVDLTCALSVAILEKGYPLLMEKPPGLNREECLRMIAAAETTGVANQVAFNRRYTPLVQSLKAMLTAKDAPRLYDVRYDFFRINRRDADFATTAIHGIDTAKFLAGAEYTRVHMSYQALPDVGPTVANIFMECEFASGVRGHLNFCPATGVLIERATLAAQDQTFFLEIPINRGFDFPGRLLRLRRGDVLADLHGAEPDDGDEDPMYICAGFYGENAAFFDALRKGEKPAGDIRSGLQSVEIADCIRQRRTEYTAG